MWTQPKITHNRPTKWFWMVTKPEHFTLGQRTDIGAFSYIQASQGVTIEDDVQVGSHCSIYSVSSIDGKQGQVIIKKNARIGTHAVIMPGVTIGENSIVGAFSFVTCDIPANQIWYGCPAHFAKYLQM